ncbi:MAG: hypothetical protein ACREEC_10755 [Thermoplasmata archaeon]
MADVSTCPGCGAEVSYAVQETRVLTGTCADCHRVTTLVEGPLPPGTAALAEGEKVAAGGEDAGAPGGPECAECGSPLSISAREDGMLEVSCAECETTTTFVPEGSHPPPPARGRPERYGRSPRPDDARGEGPSNARPCRQCGAPLKFTTDAEGVLTGECSSCGNRFTLPPRRDSGFGREDRGGGRRDGARGPPRYGRRPGGYSGGGGYGGRAPNRGGSGGYRSRDNSRDDASSDDDARRRRRPRRE